MYNSTRNNNEPYRLQGDYSNPPRERAQPAPLTRVSLPQPRTATRPTRDLQVRIASAQEKLVAAMQCQDPQLKDSEIRKALQQMQQLSMQSDDIEPEPPESQDHTHEDNLAQETDHSDCEQDPDTSSFVDVEALIHAVQNAPEDDITKDDLLSLLQQHGASSFTLQTFGSFLDDPRTQAMLNSTIISLLRTIIDTGASIDCAAPSCKKFLRGSTFLLSPPINIAMGKGKMEIRKGGLILRIFRNNTPCLNAETNPYVVYVSPALMTPFDDESLDITSAHVAKRLGIGLIVAPGQNTGTTLINI